MSSSISMQLAGMICSGPVHNLRYDTMCIVLIFDIEDLERRAKLCLGELRHLSSKSQPQLKHGKLLSRLRSDKLVLWHPSIQINCGDRLMLNCIRSGAGEGRNSQYIADIAKSTIRLVRKFSFAAGRTNGRVHDQCFCSQFGVKDL